MSLAQRFAAATPEEAARRRFGLWAALALIVLLPLWWIWGADLAAAALRPLVGVVIQPFGLSGRIDVPTEGGWAIWTHLTQGGEPIVFPLPQETLKRLLLGFPLAAAFFIAPPRPTRPWRVLAISLVVLSLTFAAFVILVVWGELAPTLNPELASPSMTLVAHPDQPPLHPILAQIAIVGRYVSLSIASLLTALLLWGTLNPNGLQTLAAEMTVEDEPTPT